MPMTSDQLALTRQTISDPGTDAVQTITIANATGGSFTLTFNGQTTSAIPYPSGANVVQNALAALSNVGVGNVAVTENAGVPGSIFYAVYFGGTLAGAAQPMITINAGSLTGTGVTTSIVQALAGGITAFSDAELNANFDLAKSNFFLGIAYDVDNLRMNAARFNRYTVGQSQEFKEQIFDHLSLMSEFYHQWANADRQVQFTTLAPTPPRLRAVPIMPGTPAQALNYGQTPWGPWGRRGPWNGSW